MKNKQEIQKEILALEKQFGYPADSKEKRRAAKRVKFLRSGLLYLETSPSVEFAKKQRADLLQKQRLFKKAFYAVPDYCVTADMRKDYRNEVRAKFQPGRIKSQIELLSFLLESTPESIGV